MVSTKFIYQTKQLEHTLDTMSKYCIKGLSLCKHALYDKDKTLTQEVNELHEEVIVFSRECEQICMRILLLQHPVAKDLRKITVTTNIVKDMTRIMDHQKEVADLICMISDEDCVIEAIQKLFDVTNKMISLSINSYMTKDVDMASSIIKLDDEADMLYREIKESYIEFLASSKYDAENLVNLLLIGKYLERMCDHCVNICKWVLYLKDGVYVE